MKREVKISNTGYELSADWYETESNQVLLVLPGFTSTKKRYEALVIKTYEDSMREIAEQHNIPFIPVFDEFTGALSRGRDLLPDGLHPNDAGHQLITDTVMPRLQELFV